MCDCFSLVSADSGPVIHKDCSKDLLVENPPVEFGRPAAGVVGGRTETENDDAEIVEKMTPQEAEQEPPQIFRNEDTSSRRKIFVSKVLIN